MLFFFPLSFAGASAQTLRDSRLRLETWASGLSTATTFAFVGRDEVLILQKDDGLVRWFKDGVDKGVVLDLDVMNYGSAGLIGIALDPDFTTNAHVFLMYSASSAGADSGDPTTWVDHRLERYDWNGAALVNPSGPLFALPNDPNQSDDTGHAIGPIRFGSDGMIYGQVGDHSRGKIGSGVERVEQNTAATGSAIAGAIFRVASDGTIPADNPFTAETDTNFHPWWSYGLRNGFGIAIDPLTGNLWDTENGPEKYDEINLVPKGMNSGWILIMGPDARNAAYIDNQYTSYNADDLVYLQNALYVDPELSFRKPIGITAIEFLHSKRFPEDLRDDLLFGDTNGGKLYFVHVKPARDELELNGGLADKVVDSWGERAQLILGDSFLILTDIQVGPDGYVYLLDYYGGALYRMRPVTDLVEPSEILLAPNMSTSGTPEDREISDDRSFVVIQNAFAVPRPYEAVARFVLNEANPTSIVVNLEDHYSAAGVIQQIHAFNVTNSAWDLLDTSFVGTVDATRSLNLANPAQYIDPNDLSLSIRVSAKALPSGLGGSRPHPLTGLFDLIRLDVTYP